MPSLPPLSTSRPFAPRALLVTMFEPAGGPPGEFAAFCAAENLVPWAPFPAGHGDLWANEHGLVAVVAGIGTAHAASTIMALGLDPRLDLRATTFLLAGIAGINPRFASLASAAWVRYVVDGDLAHEIDAREMPAHWPDGHFPLGSADPDVRPRRGDGSLFTADEVHALNPALAQWAYNLTRDVSLTDLDTPAMAAARARYADTPEATRPPFVLLGDQLAGSRFWHGALSNAWAERWVRLWTDGQGTMVVSAMEENGSLRAFRRLHQAGRADFNRILVLRTGSNYTCPPSRGPSALESLTGGATSAGTEAMYPGYDPSRLVLQRLGSRVLQALLAGEGPA